MTLSIQATARRWLNGSALLLAACSAFGCVDISKTRVRTDENVIDKRPKVVPSARFAANVEVRDNILRVKIASQCSLVEEEKVEATEVSDKTVSSDARVWMTALALAGSVPLTGGTVMLADSPSVYDSDLNARLYNQTGQETVIGVGTALVSLGLACVLPPMINGLRAVGSSETTTTTTRVGAVLEDKTPCRGLTAPPSYAVVARFAAGQVVPLGAAVADDEFHVDLPRILGPTLLGMSPPPASVAIWINEKFQTEVPTASILEAARGSRETQDDVTWAKAEPSGCAQTPTACAQVQAYLSLFPNGKHADEARKLLQPRSNVVAGGAGPESKLARAVEAAAKQMTDTQTKLDKQASDVLDKAQKKAAEESKKVCQKECSRICEKDELCRQSCVVQVCP